MLESLREAALCADVLTATPSSESVRLQAVEASRNTSLRALATAAKQLEDTVEIGRKKHLSLVTSQFGSRTL